MKLKITDPKTRLYMIPAIILLVGLAASVMIYFTAGDETESVYGYVMINGHAYPVRHEDSKTYRHDLELYGGKWNVVSNELIRWFTGLWEGKSLAFTVAGISALTATLFYFIAKHPSVTSRTEDRDRINRLGTDKK